MSIRYPTNRIERVGRRFLYARNGWLAMRPDGRTDALIEFVAALLPLPERWQGEDGIGDKLFIWLRTNTGRRLVEQRASHVGLKHD